MDYLMSIKPETVTEVKLSSLNKNQCYILMPFAEAKVLNPSILKKFHNAEIERIDLVYTTYTLSSTFKQPELNRSRFQSLKNFAPELFDNNAIEWHVVAQTKAKSPEQGKKMFHGFIITCQGSLTASGKSDLTLLKEMLKPKKPAKDTIRWFKTMKTHYDVYYLPLSKRKREAGIRYTHRSIWFRKPVTEKTVTIDSIRRRTKKGFDPYDIGNANLTDSTIFKVLERNKNWHNMVVVEDVTGSMGPYTAQLLVWNRLTFQTRKTTHFVFFNDGDDKLDSKKQIGSTGGIYYINAADVRDVESMAMKAMSKGSGGDAPENNIEALLQAIKDCPDCELVMIADNMANVKDISLLSQVNRPVHIILCGAKQAVNTEYLDIARSTKGSVHTIDDDLDDLMNLSEGQQFTIRHLHYVIRNGKFRMYYSD
jgi:hypothetical protein